MTRFAKIALSLSLAAAALPQVAAAGEAVQISAATAAADYKGKMLYTASGDRLAAIYRVAADGNAQIILNGKMVNVPASSLTAADGKLTTSLSTKDLLTAH